MRLNWIVAGYLVGLIQAELDLVSKPLVIDIKTKGNVTFYNTMISCSGCFWPSSMEKDFSEYHSDFVKEREKEFKEFLYNEYYWYSYTGETVHKTKDWQFIWSGARYVVQKQECRGEDICTIKMTYLGNEQWLIDNYNGPDYNKVGNLTSAWTYSIDHHKRSVIAHTFSKSCRSIWFNPVNWYQFDTYYYRYFSGVEGYAYDRSSSMKLTLRDPIINQQDLVLPDGLFGYESQTLLDQ